MMRIDLTAQPAHRAAYFTNEAGVVTKRPTTQLFRIGTALGVEFVPGRFAGWVVETGVPPFWQESMLLNPKP